MATLTSKTVLFLFLEVFYLFYSTNSFEKRVKIRIAVSVLTFSAFWEMKSSARQIKNMSDTLILAN